MMHVRGAPLRKWGAAVAVLIAAVVVAPAVHAQSQGFAAQWLTRVTQAARSLNYSGTVMVRQGARYETFRLAHLFDNGEEYEKLLSLDGPAREIVRSAAEVRYYFPDAKVVRVEPRTIRNVFPSLSPEQTANLAQYYEFKLVPGGRVAGRDTEVAMFDPKDGMRYGHRFWADPVTGLLLKSRLVNEKGETIEEFAFTDVTVNAKIDKDMLKPSWASVPADWEVKQGGPGQVAATDTGWTVAKLPPGFIKIMEGMRTLAGKRTPVAHLVYSDGLVAISVFVEPFTVTQTQVGLTEAGGLAQYRTRSDAFMVTVMGEAPPATVRQMAQSVVRKQ
ncbi:MAG: MucB/RseB C-terminal domain-containing protein [Burkholderiales bacterium]|nr:MucB/RseB C-terminal domain-containing protein [Burkholderiales bacterium]